MTLEEMQAHAKRYSHNYKGGTDKWGLTDFHTMAIKTVLKRLLSKYGILSIEMMNGPQLSTALQNDGGVIKDEGDHFDADFEGETVDVTPGDEVPDFVDPDTGEIVNNEDMFKE